ncbi:TetR/AcrR family transcriptional regulator [Parvularcula sp. IMCC14364]|uniref:TetR/AcrR family transcriptional regulator n=1 Tax=Parvularcula sp. IMCC14364 TaxID=3067902 RepID=UPI002741C42F|nr:TetR/AcrR family transcriptional regulator [Parvularcula sp. IMCC14364]
MATQTQRTESTRAQLVQAFRTSLLERGLAATTTQHVLARTGLSKGAMYHHFNSKTDIIKAIYEAESRGAIARAAARVEDISSPLEKLIGACLAWTEEVRVPSVSRILFEIGPAALGPQQAREIEDSYSLKQIEHLLELANVAQEINVADVRLTAALINALVAEATLYTLRSGRESGPVLRDAIGAILKSCSD